MNILIAGDFCPQDRVAEKFEQGDYESVLGEVKDVITSADYSIVNFECPVTKGGEKPIEKCGPNHCCSEKGMEAVKWVGFNCVTLANNHFLDFGKEGVVNTLAACSKYGVNTVGGGMNLKEASKILYKEIKGETLAIINCCEHEFSIATETSAGSNPLNPIQQYNAIIEAKEKSDYILVIVHGGHEHYQLPSLRMQETYRFFIEVGADAVVNHHQHCYSGYEVYKGKPIFYGLGNFCFDHMDKRNSLWNEGYLLGLCFDNNVIKYEVYPYCQCNNDASITNMNNQKEFGLILGKLNSIIENRNELQNALNSFYEESAHESVLLFQPYTNRLFSKLFKLRLLPTLLSKNHMLKILNRIACESHREKITYTQK